MPYRYSLHLSHGFRNQQVALGILKNLGVMADAVSSGSDAVRQVKTIFYDLVFMDMQMPDMDGLEATRLIRAHEESVRKGGGGQGKRIPVIAVTANASAQYREKCFEAGMDDYITKPISLEAVSNLLAKWLFGGVESGVGQVRVWQGWNRRCQFLNGTHFSSDWAETKSCSRWRSGRF